MVEVNHKPTEDDPNSYEIVGDSVDELMEFCLPRIRQQSKGFYKESLRKDLETTKKSLIDRHAGNGNFYKVKYEAK